MQEKSISVIIPCYNEGPIIYRNLGTIRNYLESISDDFELIAVNDGSTDNTFAELERASQVFPVVVVNNGENEGKGRAVRDGVMASSKDIVMFLDADLGIPIEELEKFVEELDKGFDIAIASRFVPGTKIVSPVSRHRRFLEKSYRLFRILIVNLSQIKDTQCGFKVMKRNAAVKIFPRLKIKKFSFDVELLFLAKKYKLKIKELPISLENPPATHIRLVRDSMQMLWDLFRIRINDWRGRYD